MAARKGSVRKRHTKACGTHRGGRCRCSGTWQIRYYDNLGKRHQEGGFATKDHANARLDDVLAAVRDGSYRERVEIGLSEFAEVWLDRYARHLKPATLVDYRGVVRNHLGPYFGDQLITTITAEHIDAYLADKMNAGRWSAKTIHNTYTVLRRILESAVEWDYIPTNPAAKVKPIKREKPEREILTVDEVGMILDTADEPWRLIFFTAFMTGLRRGELLGLRWGDLELDRRRFHVRQTFGRYGFQTPKSAAGRRVVPLTDRLVRELRRHKLAAPPNEHDLVFASQVGTPLDPGNLKRAWERTLRQAGLRHVSFHTTRHTAVSLMIASEGLNPKQLQTIIGHASIQLTFDTYGHLMPDSFDGFGSALDEVLRLGLAGDRQESSLPERLRPS